MSFKFLAVAGVLALVSLLSRADDSFESIAGFRLGDECPSPKFTKKSASVSNPEDALDKIEVLRSVHESTVEGGYKLKVECGLIDNKVSYINLDSSTRDGILSMRASLREKMRRPPDEKDSLFMEPKKILGEEFDGFHMDWENWNLKGERQASTHLEIGQPFGTKSRSDLKYRGGISLSYPNRSQLEWEYLKQRGLLSPEEKKAIDEKKRRDGVKGLLN